jgi:hypothetical protein
LNKDNQFHTDQYQGTDKDRLQSGQDFSSVFTEPLKAVDKDNLPYGCDREFRKHDVQNQTFGKETFGQSLNKDSSTSQQSQQGQDFSNVYKQPLEEASFRQDAPQMSEGCQQYGQPFGGQQQYGQQYGQQFEKQYGMEKPSSYTQQGQTSTQDKSFQSQQTEQPRKHSYFVQPDPPQQQQPSAGESTYQD